MANGSLIEDSLIDDFTLDSDLFAEPVDKTYVSPYPNEQRVPEIHDILMAAGLIPGIGNVADAADALLYLAEGEYGEAAFAAGAMIPIAGQYISARKFFKKAKDSGEKFTTVYRGVDKWHTGKMVKNGHFVGGGGDAFGARNLDMFEKVPKKGSLYTSKSFSFAEEYAKKDLRAHKLKLQWLKNQPNAGSPMSIKHQKELKGLIKKGRGPVLEFEVPNSYLDEFSIKTRRPASIAGDNLQPLDATNYAFPHGLPREFLKKVHK